MGFLIGFPLFIVSPCVIAVWLGTRVRLPVVAFALAWVMTPIASWIITIVLWPILRALIPPNNDGTGAIMIPIFGIATGLIAGIVAAVIVRRRQDKVAATTTAEQSDALEPAARSVSNGKSSPPTR